jgi:demethylmenaquinone methyltransferase/2-methoxy-6-polyprenyl-1,4-benzoquinol methylase
VTRAGLNKRPADVAAMFDETAARYDLMNRLLSLGLDQRWRTQMTRDLAPRRCDVVLDLAAGTGTSSEPLADAGVRTVPADFSLGMLSVGKRRRPDLDFVAADGEALPFAADSFDAVTISFGLRNISDRDGALGELCRVTKTGGRLVVCEFSTPTLAALRTVYQEYLMRALPAVAARASSNPESYRYLAESIRAWPDQAALADSIRAAGWPQVRWRNLTGGIVALHRAVKA